MSGIAQDNVFSIKKIWDDALYNADEEERARYIVSHIPEECKTVLDAGCGAGIVTNRIKGRKVFGTDRTFIPLLDVNHPSTESDLSKLPFDDLAFDVSICSEVLEHIPYFSFESVKRELARVSKKYILIDVPWNQDLRRSKIECPQCYCEFQPHYHVRSFAQKDFENLFLSYGFKVNFIGTIGAKTKKLSVRSLLDPFIKKKFPLTTICPLCGYQNNENNVLNVTMVDKQPKYRNLLKDLANRGLVISKRPHYWFAVYQRIDER